LRREGRFLGVEEEVSCESFAEGQPCGLKCGGNGRFKSFEGVVIRNFGRDE
jgi:hypothetical protein